MAKYLTLNEAKEQFFSLPEKLTTGPAIITKEGKPVMITFKIEQFESWLETLAIMADSELMADLKEGIKQVENGETITLEELESELGFS